MARINRSTLNRVTEKVRLSLGQIQMTPNAQTTESLVTTKRGLDLDTFGDVTLYKKVAKPAPVASVQDALSRLGNDHQRLLSILTQGIEADAVQAARSDESGWHLIDENGKQTEDAFEGTLVPESATPLLNGLVLQLAKNVFGYEEAKDADGRRDAKVAARDYIKSQPVMLAGIQARIKTASNDSSAE